MKFLDKLKKKFKKDHSDEQSEDFEEYSESEYEDDEDIEYEEIDEDEEDFTPSEDSTAEIAVRTLAERSEDEEDELDEDEDEIDESLLADTPSEEDIDRALAQLREGDDGEMAEFTPADDEEEEIPSIQDVLEKARQEENRNYQFDEDESDDEEEGFTLSSIDEDEAPKKRGFFSKFSKDKEPPAPENTKAPRTSVSLKEMNAEELLKLIFSSESRPFIHKGFIASSIIVASYVCGSLSAQFLEKQLSPKKSKVPAIAAGADLVNWRTEVANIRRTNPFNIKLNEENLPKREGPKVIDKNLVCHQSSNKSQLPIKLLNTIVLQDTVKSIAAVQSRGKLINMREGEKVNGIAEIGRINSSQVVVKNLQSGECEYIEMDGKKEAPLKNPIKWVNEEKGKKIIAQTKTNEINQEGNNFKIKKSYRDKMLQNIGEILTQARAVPIKNADGTLSFKMVEVQPGSLFAQLNIQNGDVINSINGKKYNNINELMALFGQLKNNDSYEISVQRDGTEQTFNYNFE